MEELKEKLIKSIEENGISSQITIKLSQELDKFIVDEMRSRMQGIVIKR